MDLPKAFEDKMKILLKDEFIEFIKLLKKKDFMVSGLIH